MVLFCLNVLETIFENMSLFAICYALYVLFCLFDALVYNNYILNMITINNYLDFQNDL